MRLFRVFDWDGSSLGDTRGGPLFVPRHSQGSGRHDSPDRYGAWYCSREAVSAVAESIQFARGQPLEAGDFVNSNGSVRSLVEIQLDDAILLPDLDDPSELVARGLRPSQVATRRRRLTQQIALSIFDEGAPGFMWWSTLDADWRNVTLFHERALPVVSLRSTPKRLSVRLSEVQEAAERLGVQI